MARPEIPAADDGVHREGAVRRRVVLTLDVDRDGPDVSEARLAREVEALAADGIRLGPYDVTAVCCRVEQQREGG